jgi:hypothetical protein
VKIIAVGGRVGERADVGAVEFEIGARNIVGGGLSEAASTRPAHEVEQYSARHRPAVGDIHVRQVNIDLRRLGRPWNAACCKRGKDTLSCSSVNRSQHIMPNFQVGSAGVGWLPASRTAKRTNYQAPLQNPFSNLFLIGKRSFNVRLPTGALVAPPMHAAFRHFVCPASLCALSHA